MDDLCECGKATDDHTLRELRVCHPAEALNLPYQEAAAQVPADEMGAMCSGMVVRGLVVPCPAGYGLPSTLPALGFTFFAPDGLTEVARILLVLDDDRMRELRTVVGSAIDGALKHARRRR